MSRVFGPKSADMAAEDTKAGRTCPGCQKPFGEGDYTTLVAIGPGDDEEAQARAREGRPYNAVAVEVHAACAGEETP
jgi:hypothetical protein